MQQIFSSKKGTIQQNWCIYLMINCAFLIPVLLFTQFPQIAEPIVNFLGYIFLFYWMPIILYYLLGLTYVHCVLSIGFLIFFIYKLVKEKNRELFLPILLLTIVSIALNYYWITHGRPYTVV